jgi:methyl-accepting chemotaxis protein
MDINENIELKKRLDYEFREKYKDLVKLGIVDRFSIVILGAILIVVGNLLNITNFPWIVLAILPSVLILENIFLIIALKKDFVQIWMEFIVCIGDVGGVCLVMAFTGYEKSPFFLLFFLKIFHFAIDLGLKITMYNTISTVAGYIIFLIIGIKYAGIEIDFLFEGVKVVLLFYTCFVAATLGNKSLVRLGKLRKTMAIVEKGNIDVKAELKGKDEIGWTVVSFNSMLDNLNKLATQAEVIANDDLQNEILNEKIKGKLGVAFALMVDKFKTLLLQAELIAADNLKDPLLMKKMTGDLGSAFARMVERLLKLSELAEVISSGDLISSQEVSLEGNCLVKSFNQMVQNLSEIVLNIKEAGLKIATSTNEIFSSIEELATGSSEQAASVEETSSTVEEFSVTARQIAENADIVAKLAEKTLELTVEGTKMMQAVVANMSKILETTNLTSSKIMDLGDKSRKIMNMTQVIDNITNQTKLLALNAAIEAAGTGEASRRFSVVAGDVKKLAEGVEESTEQIKGLIAEISESINSSVISTEEEKHQVGEGVAITKKLGEALNKVYEMIAKTTDATKQISLATQQQKSASEQIAITARDISNVTKQSAVSTKQVTNATSELNSLAENLKKMVNKFKIENEK